jgi:hypothetical protein
MLQKAEDKLDPDYNRFSKDEVVQSEEDSLVDDDEESIEEEYDQDKPRNPFKAPKQPKE